jgi:glutathione S-transferase
MKLYYSPGSCSLSVHIALHEAGLAFESVLASTKTKKLPDGSDYLLINPKGQVPLLELDSGERISEGVVIVQYIADQVPAKHLAPAWGTLERYRLMEWLNFITTEVHKGFSPLFMPGMPEEAKTLTRQRLRSKFEWLNQQLADKTWLMGDTFTVADGYLFTTASWARHVQLDLSDLAHLQAYLTRVGARPAVQAAMRSEGLIK